MPEWRRNQIPACPVCRRGRVDAHHRDCRAKNASLWVDLETGWVQCAGCNTRNRVENWNHYCDCGVVYNGGEIWQGMAAEAGQLSAGHLGHATWFRAVAVQRGTLEIKLLGWSICAACRKKSEGSDYFTTGGSKGGLCAKCQEALTRLFKKWFTFKSTPNICAWCGDENYTGRTVDFKRTRICRACFERMTFKWSLDFNFKL